MAEENKATIVEVENTGTPPGFLCCHLGRLQSNDAGRLDPHTRVAQPGDHHRLHHQTPTPLSCSPHVQREDG